MADAPARAEEVAAPPASAAEPSEPDRRLAEATAGLRTRKPELSAAYGMWPWQRRVLCAALLALGPSIYVAHDAALMAVMAAVAVPFLAVVVLHIAALWHSRAPAPAEPKPPSLSEAQLPLYTIFVPLFHEAAVVADLLAAMRRLDYPPARLELMLIVEACDAETQEALRRADIDPHMQVLVVPDGQPRTKPRAIQYALQFARGDYVVVYDAEDDPAPDQLRRALAVLESGGPRLGCVQAQLNIYNSDATWFTRQFTIEYTALFDCILPTLERLGLPMPLGGTSNHFPRAVLDAVGGWDPYNVTEDADLGIRLARHGWHVGVLRSTTWEEAPPNFHVWKGQRTRWLKGWIQTYRARGARKFPFNINSLRPQTLPHFDPNS